MPSHYNFAFDNISQTYNFTTRHGIICRVAFVVDDTFSALSGQHIPDVYQLVIEKANDTKAPFDILIAATITELVKEFFLNITNALIFFCSDDDSKALKRFKTFDRWHQKSPYSKMISKKNQVISIRVSENENAVLHTSLMYHVKNKHKKQLLDIYFKIEEYLDTEK